MSDMIDLLPCPFCGGPDTRHFNNPDEFGRPSHGIQCANGECWVCGPECETPSEAIAAWNRRAALPPAPDAVGALVKAGELPPKVELWMVRDALIGMAESDGLTKFQQINAKARDARTPYSKGVNPRVIALREMEGGEG